MKQQSLSPFLSILQASIGGALLTALAAAHAQASPPAPANPGSLSLQMDQQGSTLVVADVLRQSLAIYRIDNVTVRLLAVRNLDADFSGEPPRELPAASLPTKDVPGQDPPDFDRPPHAVRSSSTYQAEFGPSERWFVTYLVPGTTSEIFAKLRAALKGWKLTNETADADGRAGFKVVKDKSTIDVSVTPVRGNPSWVQVQVSEDRPR